MLARSTRTATQCLRIAQRQAGLDARHVRLASQHAISNPTLADIEKRWERMPPQEQADLWMALRDRMKTDWHDLTLQERKTGQLHSMNTKVRTNSKHPLENVTYVSQNPFVVSINPLKYHIDMGQSRQKSDMATLIHSVNGASVLRYQPTPWLRFNRPRSADKAYWIAFGPHGPRAEAPPGEGWWVFKMTAIGVTIGVGLFALIRTQARAPPKTMNAQYQEMTNEYLRSQNNEPITGLSSEGYSGKGQVQSKPRKGGIPEE